MSLYTCTHCGYQDQTGWTDYYIRLAMHLPALCAVCDPHQRCHWHTEAARRAQDEADFGEVEGE